MAAVARHLACDGVVIRGHWLDALAFGELLLCAYIAWLIRKSHADAAALIFDEGDSSLVEAQGDALLMFSFCRQHRSNLF